MLRNDDPSGYVIADAVKLEKSDVQEVCPGVECDNGAAGFSTVGSWSSSASIGGFYGTDYLHDGNAAKGTKTASWTYLTVEPGDYQIAARWSAYSNRASSVQYRYSANGITADCGAPVNQRINGGTFNVLCTVPSLAAGTTVTVMLRNDDPSGYVIADAVRFQRTSP
jgi:hypothetical protein